MTNKNVKTTTVSAVMLALASTALAGGIANTANDITITDTTVANQTPTASVNGS